MKCYITILVLTKFINDVITISIEIKVVITEYNGISIDTEHDLRQARMIV